MARPARLKIEGESFVPAVLQVVDRREDGSPLTLRLIRDDETVKIEGGEEFLVVYASARAVNPRS